MRIVTRVPLILLLVLVPASTASAQQDRPTSRRNAVYVEILGNGGLYSFNVERDLERVRLRIGVAAWSAVDFLSSGGETKVLTVPLTAYVVRGRGHHHVELGGGLLVGRRTTREPFAGPDGGFASLVGILGYRRQRPEGRFVFRAGFTPFVGLGREEDAYPDKGFFPSLGVSFGAAF